MTSLAVLEHLAEWFYDPAVFWGAPLVLALLVEAYRSIRRGRGGR